MAARKRRPNHNEKSREKIQVSQLVNRLSNHALGECEMTSTQVRAAEILLKKKLPDLSSTDLIADVSADVDMKYRVEVVDAVTDDGK